MGKKHADLLWRVVLGAVILLGAVAVEAQTQLYNGEIVWSEDFEAGWGDWYADNGVWQIGEPLSGPTEAFEGSSVAGTNLSGDYPLNTDSRLISPVILLPRIGDTESLQLRFWQWFSYSLTNSGLTDPVELPDHGYVQIREFGPEGWSAWEYLGVCADESSPAWSRTSMELTAYAGQSVQISFCHDETYEDPTWHDHYESMGWYIDAVQIWWGTEQFVNREGFEFGWGGWYADNGLWQIGQPASGFPAAFAGSSVAGTNLSGDYPPNTDSRLISPVIVLPSVRATESLQLRFWQWFSYSLDKAGLTDPAALPDCGCVEVRECGPGGWSTWQNLCVCADETSSGWSHASQDLTAYAGKTIQIAFYHDETYEDATWHDHYENRGWYIDEVEIWQGTPQFINPEGYEFGWGDWHADNGLWQIGQPASGPAQAFEGSSVAGTNLSGDYPPNTDSRLISPAMTLPNDERMAPGQMIRLGFSQWFSYATGSADTGHVEIRVLDLEGWSDWQDLGSSAAGVSGGWSRTSKELTSYAGETVEIAFRHDDTYEDPTWKDHYEGAGWYIDDVQITPPPQTWMVSEDTGVSRTDKVTSDTTPELTFVFPFDVSGEADDILIKAPDGQDVVPDTISGWGTNTVVAGITTPLTRDGTYVIVLSGITDVSGSPVAGPGIMPFTLDTVAPNVCWDVEALADGTIVMTGTVDDPEAVVEVLADENAFATRNNGDGTWILPTDLIDPFPAGGVDDLVVIATDRAGNMGDRCGTCELALSSTSGGSIEVPGEGLFPYPSCEETVVVTATADVGYRFVRWEGTACDADRVTVIEQDDSGSMVEVLVDAGYTLVAVFEPQCCLTLDVVGDGSIDPDEGVHYYPCGTMVQVCAEAGVDSRFVRWEGTAVTEGKIEAGETESCVLVSVDGVDDGYTLTAVFEAIVYDFSLDTDPRWDLEGQWSFGVPTGQRCSGWGHLDPTGGYTGPNVIGVNLDGCYDLLIGGPYAATVGPLDLTGYTDVTLKFRRWLNTDIPEYVRCMIEVSTDGQAWTVIWEQGEREEITDTAWTLCEYPLPQADLQSTVYVRWTYEVVRERAYAYTGWNLDDIQLIGTPQ